MDSLYLQSSEVMLSVTHVSEPHSAIICGQTGCGKTQFVLDELLHLERLQCIRLRLHFMPHMEA